MKPQNEKELLSTFLDNRYSKASFQSLCRSAILRQAKAPDPLFDPKTGEELPQSQLLTYSYNSLIKDIQNLSSGDNRGPTDLELLIESQKNRALMNGSDWAIFMDRIGLKPTDESKIDAGPLNPLADYTDEQLEAINLALLSLEQKKVSNSDTSSKS